MATVHDEQTATAGKHLVLIPEYRARAVAQWFIGTQSRLSRHRESEMSHKIIETKRTLTGRAMTTVANDLLDVGSDIGVVEQADKE